MKKFLTYFSFALTSLLVILAFVTATTYLQLGVAIILYPPIAYFAYKVFLVKSPKVAAVAPKPAPVKPNAGVQTEISNTQTAEISSDISISDIDKRAFLKLIGTTGVSFFLFSFLSRRTDSLLFGKQSEPGLSSLTDGTGNKIDPAERHPTDGFTISEIDDRGQVYYGFTNIYGAWFIMKEADDGSFRYSKGESNFPVNWDTRDDLTYDYFHRTF